MLVAAGTPTRRGDGYANLRYVYAATGKIAATLDGFTVVATKSTVPVGTGECEALPDADVRLISTPEFLRDGIWDFKHPDRIVIGRRAR